MKTFKTKAGTELPLLNLKGKDYLQVAHRLVWFREEHPDWTISTSLIEYDKDHALFRAEIRSSINMGQIIATAHKREDLQGFADYLEKAETGAIGRALALCGYGTQFAEELDEHDRIVDSPIQPVIKTPVQVKGNEMKREALNKEIIQNHKTFTAKFPSVVMPQVLKEKYNVNETKLLSLPQLEDFSNFMKKSIASGTLLHDEFK